ncbi:MAG TPA: hypothetical protein PLA41_00705 [Candidatus Pacearchaeota archaeon]|nr:hypothetical protein [Candidatus Parcubacteria bacterium]HOU45657.1 hypothetical protein [Candidatus Pacearchaeota archaeon]HPM08281.1 hypothetical protein [Candidatus Pacearchaeota archaeon]HQI74586.1 hypothetical protein [Candidatus Pacearchaeota archaeon]
MEIKNTYSSNNVVCEIHKECETCPQKDSCYIILENRKFVKHREPKD